MGYFLNKKSKKAERTRSVTCRCGATVRMVAPDAADMTAQCAGCFAKANPGWTWPAKVKDVIPMGNALLRRQM